MSLRSGTWWITHGSLVSSVAARIGRAEFFEPLILTVPASELPPWTRILSIGCEDESVMTLVVAEHANVLIIVRRQQRAQRLRLIVPDLEREPAAQMLACVGNETVKVLQARGAAVERGERI